MPKKAIDNWSAIEKAYQETRVSVSSLAAANGLCHATVANHMRKAGITRNPQTALQAPAPSALPDQTPDDLAELRKAVQASHRQHIGLDHARLNAIATRLDANAKLSDKQRLDALQIIVKVRAQIVELERRAHSIVDQAPAVAPVAIQVNIDMNPHDAYMQLIGKL